MCEASPRRRLQKTSKKKFCSISVAQGIEIKEQSLVIEEQYQESLKTQSEILASVASEKLQQGDRKAAIENALNALPVYFADPERPIVPEAVYALSSALRVYDNGEILQPDFYLEQKSDITCVRTLGENYLFTIDEKGLIWIWDIANQKLVAQYQGEYSVKSCDGIFGFHNDEVFYGLENDCVKAYAINETKVLWSQAIENPEYLFYNLEKKEVFIVANDCFYLLDSETGDVKVKNEIPQECMGKRISYVQASREGSCYYVAFCNSDSVILKIEGSDLQSEIIVTIDEEVERINISADDASLFCVMNTYDMESGAMSVEIRGAVVCYSLESKEHKWEYRGTGHVENVFLLDENVLLVRKRNGLTEVDIDSGSEIRSMEMDCHIAGVYALNSGKYQILLNDGTVAFEFDNFNFSIMEANYNIIGNQFEDFQRIGNNYFTLEHNSNRILVYDTKMSEKATESTLTKEQVEEKYGQERHEWDGVSVISEEMEQQACIDPERNAIIFQSLNDGEEQGEYPCATSFIDSLLYSPDGRFIFIEYANSTVELVDTITFTCTNSYEDIEDIYGCENMNDEYMVLVSLTGSYVFEQASGSCIAKVSGYLAYDEEENIFYISGGDAVYTIPFNSTEQLVDIANERVE